MGLFFLAGGGRDGRDRSSCIKNKLKYEILNNSNNKNANQNVYLP